MEEVESHRQKFPLAKEGLGLPLGGKGFPGNIITYNQKVTFVICFP